MYIQIVYHERMKFRWDSTKAAEHWRDHKVSFDEAIEAFFDPNGKKEQTGDEVVVAVTPVDPRQARARKATVTMRLDPDIIQYFKARALKLGVAGYQTLINDTLRAAMERDPMGGVKPAEVLLSDEAFISALAAKVTERVQQRSAG